MASGFYLKANKPSEAGRHADAAVGLAERQGGGAALVEPLNTRAMVKIEQKDLRGALADAERVLRLDPSNKQAAEMRGLIRASLRAPLKVKIRGVDFGPSLDGEAAVGNLGPHGGPAAPGSGRAAEASSGGTAAAGGGPAPGRGGPARGPASGLVSEAFRKLRINDPNGALLDAARAIDADPKNPRAWALRAAANNRLKQYPPALKDAGQALSLDSNDALALRESAYAEYQLGNFGKALADARRAVDLDPKDALGWLYRAMAEDKLGAAAKAREDYAEAARLDPGLAALVPGSAGGGAVEAGGRASPPPSGDASAGGDGSKRSGLPFGRGAALRLLGLLLLSAGAAGWFRRRGSKIGIATDGATPSETPAPVLLAPGVVVGGGFRIVKLLGRGGMGEVYEAIDSKLDRAVAVKRVHELLKTDPKEARRFLEEAKTVASLRHPNIVTIYQTFEEGGDLYQVFEKVDGETLSDALSARPGGRLEAGRCAGILRQCCEGIDYAHGRGVLHRDLKPANIMLERETVKITDFGIARRTRSAELATRTSTAAGTPAYMAPEAELGELSRESDLYALAVTLYEMLTGRRPFRAAEDKLAVRFAPPSEAVAGLPAGLASLFQKALSRDRAGRFHSGKEFCAEFLRASRSRPEAERPCGPQ